ncbi:hypothetical protein QQZ08_002705 [Neonectria magnoliae]|uniref:Amino acid permease/ SLC12A domain-containing protein n=1 Tax=Neonectria magnoliae TaxID=2732573 RepID=A0ABR1IAS1_9HYPO
MADSIDKSGPVSATVQQDCEQAPDDEKAPLADHGADSQLHRRLGTRHLTMIGLGGSIGMGLWLGSGSSLSRAGPASLFLGYLLTGTMIWSVSHSIGEMAIMYPVPSAFVQWTNKFVDPAAGFALGWAYTFAYWISIANELQGIVTIEVVASTIKFGFIFVVIISGIILSAGGGPKGGFPPVEGGRMGFEFWNSTPFINGAKGFFSIMPVCIFALAGSESSSLVASETSNPRRSVPHAVTSIWVRLALFYIMGGFIITINVSPTDPNLFGGSGTNASPFVIMYKNCGVMPLAHMMNAVIFISVLSTGTISGYGGSRVLLGLSQIGMAPKVLQKTDSWGRPWYGLVPTLLIGGGLSYINISNSGAKVFTWFSNLSSLFTLFGWAMICLSHIRMRHAWKIQGRDHANLPWKSWAFPYSAYWGLTWCVILLVILLYLAISPLNGDPSATHFFSSYVSVIAIFALYAGAKIYYRGGRWVNAAEIDLDASRRFYHDDQLEDTRLMKKAVIDGIRSVVW